MSSNPGGPKKTADTPDNGDAATRAGSSSDFVTRLTSAEQSASASREQPVNPKKSSQSMGAFAATQTPQTRIEISGVSKSQILELLGKKDALPEGQKTGITLKRTSLEIDEVTRISVFDHAVLNKEVEVKPSQEFLEQIEIFKKKEMDLIQKMENAKRRKGEAQTEYDRLYAEYDQAKESHDLHLKSEQERVKRESAELEAKIKKYEADLKSWEDKQKKKEAVVEVRLESIQKERHGARFPEQFRKLDMFLDREKSDPLKKPFMNISGRIDEAERATHLHTLRKIIEYLKKKDPNPENPIYKEDVTQKTTAELQGIVQQYNKKIDEDLKAVIKTKTLVKTPEPEKRPEEPSFPKIVPADTQPFSKPKPTENKIEDEQKKVDALLREITENKEIIEKLKKGQPTSRIEEDFQQKEIATLTHSGTSIKFNITHPQDTQKVFAAVKGLKGEARINYANFNSKEKAELAFQMAVHSILTLNLVPKLNEPIPLNYQTTAMFKEFCEQLKQKIDTHNFGMGAEAESAKHQAQEGFNQFLDKNGIKFDTLKYSLSAVPTATAPQADEPVILSPHPPPTTPRI